MPSDRSIRKELTATLGGVSKQALSARVKRLKRQLPMSTEDAHYVLAHRFGIDLSRRLDPETLERVGRHVARLSSSQAEEIQRAGSAPQSGSRIARATTASPRTVVIRAFDTFEIPGLRDVHAREAKRMAERVYPILYLFENSARDLINAVLTTGIGKAWWQTLPAARAYHKTVARRMAEEGDDAWHGKRGDHPLHYLDLTVLPSIVRDATAWPHFKPLFPRANWFEGVVEDLNVSRRVVAHMNPLAETDVRQVEAGFRRWIRQLEARREEIGRLVS